MSSYNDILDAGRIYVISTTSNNQSDSTSTVATDLFTEEQLTEVVSYLYTNIFDTERWTNTFKSAYTNVDAVVSSRRLTTADAGTLLVTFAYGTVDRLKEEVDQYPQETLNHLNIMFAPQNGGGVSICAINLNPVIATVTKLKAAMALIANPGAVAIVLAGLKVVVDKIIAEQLERFNALQANVEAMLDQQNHPEMIRAAIFAALAKDAALVGLVLAVANADKIKDQLETAMAEAVSGLHNLDLTKLQYLQSLYCSMIENITHGLVSPVDSYANKIQRYQRQRTILMDRGRSTTAAATAAGRDTVNDAALKAAKDAYNANYNSYLSGIGDVYADPGKYKGTSRAVHPQPSGWSNLKFEAGVLHMDHTADRKEALRLDGLPGPALPPDIGYWGCKIDTLNRLSDAVKIAGLSQVTVYSAYRPPTYNKVVGGANNSQHKLGKAVDVSHIGWTAEQKKAFLRACYQTGFTSFGYYSTFFHVDTRGGGSTWGNWRSTWADGLPSWHPVPRR